MPLMEGLNVGIVGAAGRGASLCTALEANGARVHAVCDVREDALEECMHALGASEKYCDYGEMIETSDLDAVVVGTPTQFHVPQAPRHYATAPEGGQERQDVPPDAASCHHT
jgi:predicted dehydrogenase